MVVDLALWSPCRPVFRVSRRRLAGVLCASFVRAATKGCPGAAPFLLQALEHLPAKASRVGEMGAHGVSRRLQPVQLQEISAG